MYQLKLSHINCASEYFCYYCINTNISIFQLWISLYLYIFLLSLGQLESFPKLGFFKSTANMGILKEQEFS